MKRYFGMLAAGVFVGAMMMNFLFTIQFKDTPVEQQPGNPTETKIDDMAPETVSHNAARDGSNTVSLMNQVEKLNHEMADLKSSVTALHAQMKMLATTDPKNITTAIDSTREKEQIDQMRNSTAERQHQQGGQMESSFRQQTTDPDWSVKTKALIQDALAREKIAAENILNIECRNTMCRVELTNDDQHKLPKISNFPLLIGQELPSIMVDQISESNGSTTTILYLSKDDAA
jgi:hypothetical protein